MKQIFQTHPNRLLLCLLFTIIGGGNFAWGETYKLEKVTSVEAGGLYVFEQSGYVMANECPSSSNALQTTNSYKTTGLDGTETYVWTLEAATGGFYMKNVSLSNASYLFNTSSKTNLSFGTNGSSIWAFNFQNDGTVIIQNIKNSNRFLGFVSAEKHEYKAYAASNLEKSTYPYSIVVYQLVAEGGSHASPLTSIAVDATGATTVFHVGDTFTHEGAVVTATYEDESTKDVTDDATFNTPDMTTAGTKTVTVTYTENEVEKSTSYDIEVKAPAALESISLSGSYPTEFTQGDAFSSEGIVVTASYDDKTAKDVTEDAEFSGYNMSATGSQTVTVTYEGKTATYNITVNEYVMPSKLTVDFESALSTYKEWTFTNAEQGTTPITAHGGTYYGTTGGKQTAAFQTKDKIANPGTFTCYVSKQSTNSTSSTWYIQVSSDASTWTDVKTQSATDMDKGEWKEFTADLSDYSNVYVRLYYSGSTAVRNVDDITLEMATPQVLSSIALSGEYPTTFHQGDAFSHEGMTVTATYVSGKTADVTESATFDAPDMSTTGTKEVTVSYTENEVTTTATYEITVNAPATLTSISFSGDYPTVFEQGDEFSSEGIVITANWSDETTTNVTADATFTGYDMSSPGEQTVTVSYGGKTVTYTITVVEKKGTENNPYTVAEAIAATPASGTSANVYIQGIVSAFYKTSIVDDGSNYRYYISDDGTTTNQLLVYKGKGLEQATFDSADDLRVGDEVTIVGGLTTYNSTKEVASGNYLVSRKTTPGIAWSETEFEANLGGSNTFPTLTNTNSVAVTYSSTNTDVATIASDGTITLVAAGETTIKATFAGNASYQAQEVSYVLTVVDPTAATIELSSYSIEATAAETDGTLTATYNHITEVEADVQFCDAEGNDAKYDWIIAVINSSSKNVEYTIEANEGAARTAYFRVYALDDNTEVVYSEIVTVTQAKYIAPAKEARYALFTGALVEGDYIITHEGEKAMKASVSSKRLEYVDVTPTDNVIISSNANIVWHIAKSGDYWTIYNESEEKYAASTGTKSQADVIENGTSDNALWTANGTETFEFVNKANKAKSINANLRFNSGYGFACYATGMGKPLKLYRKVEQVEVTKAGYATYCSENALDFTGTGITAYVGTRFGDKLTFTPITQVPARTGLLLVCNGGTTANVPVLASAAAVGNNCLVGVTAATTIGAEDYILNVKEIDGEKKAGFFLAGSHTSLAANRAYIPASEGGSVKSFALDLEDNADGIEETLSDSLLKSENIYNLAGQRLSKMQKGINIVNGKKILK